MNNAEAASIRHDWQREEALALFDMPFNDLLFRAQSVHRRYFDPNEVQLSTLLSIKTGACPEDCKYCPQSGHYNTGLEKEKLLEVDKVIEEARAARDSGASRFCMGAAWRSPRDRDMPQVLRMIREVKSLGLETCMTLGMLTENQAAQLSKAGLDYYNHNLDTSPEYYGEIITTRTFQDRLDTLANVRSAGMKVCAGGIIGMGEGEKDRAGLPRPAVRRPRGDERPDAGPGLPGRRQLHLLLRKTADHAQPPGQQRHDPVPAPGYPPRAARGHRGQRRPGSGAVAQSR